MFDTVHIRLHNIEKYKNIHQFLMQKRQVSFREGDPDYYKSAQGPDQHYIFHKYVEYFQEKRNYTFTHGKVLTSSHYYIAFSFPNGVDCIDFNFSVPKILYGTNVLQFVQHHNEYEELFDYSKALTYDYNCERTYKRFLKFISLFFQKEFGVWDEKVDMKDVEIRRFDICWNMLFNNKKDAMDYLEAQKNQRKSHLRFGSRNRQAFDTSIFYSVAGYSVKIYHKGEEYAHKEEKKHHIKINKKHGRNETIMVNGYEVNQFVPAKIFDVEKIQKEADKILRFEITFHNAYNPL